MSRKYFSLYEFPDSRPAFLYAYNRILITSVSSIDAWIFVRGLM